MWQKILGLKYYIQFIVVFSYCFKYHLKKMTPFKYPSIWFLAENNLPFSITELPNKSQI